MAGALPRQYPTDAWPPFEYHAAGQLSAHWHRGREVDEAETDHRWQPSSAEVAALGQGSYQPAQVFVAEAAGRWYRV